MSITSELRSSQVFEGDGQTATFTFPFKVFNNETDITVYQADAESEVTEVVISKGLYAVTLNPDQENDPGGYITFNDPPAINERFRIVSTIPYLQNTQLANLGAFSPRTLNEVHDKLCALIQQVWLKLDRALALPYTLSKTPQETMVEILEIAAKANEYAQKAQEVYDAIGEEIASMEALKASIEELMVVFDNIKVLVEEATQNAEKTDENLAEIRQLLEEAEQEALNFSFSYRVVSGVQPGDTIGFDRISPNQNIKAGDHVLDTTTGALYPVVSTDNIHATLGEQVAMLKGDKGDKGEQGEAGPVGDQGPMGPMGQAPYATCFGQFQIDTEGELNLEYVGLEPPADFSINDNGEAVATYGNA